jgi:hypothetical protein
VQHLLIDTLSIVVRDFNPGLHRVVVDTVRLRLLIIKWQVLDFDRHLLGVGLILSSVRIFDHFTLLLISLFLLELTDGVVLALLNGNSFLAFSREAACGDQ